MKNRLVWLPLAGLLVLVALFWVGLGLDPRDLTSPRIDRPAPAFSLPDLMDPNNPVTERSLLGEPWVLNVWASWCVTCRAEHPQMLALREQGVNLVGLNYKDDFENAVAFLREHGNPYSRIAFDHQGEVGIEWGVYGTPETFVIDREGVVRLKHTGAVTPAVLEKAIMPLLRELGENS